MNIKLIYFTGKGLLNEKYFAARLLQFTKNTRLQMTPGAYKDFMAQKYSTTDVDEEMQYMSATIASSWEFVDLIFAINEVSRACAQQITRTRTASYAMQSQRVTNMKDTTCHIPDTVSPLNRTRYELALSAALSSYDQLVKEGCSLEDARGVLPMNTHCNLIAKYNLRNWIDLVRARDSMRVQGEYRNVVTAMRREVMAAWPWIVYFLIPKEEKAITLIETIAQELPADQRTQLAKAADLIKKEAS